MTIKSRMTLVYFLFMVGAIFGIICAIFELPLYLRVLDAIIVTIAIILVLKTARCPCCGKYGIRITPCSRESPCCKKCGKRHWLV